MRQLEKCKYRSIELSGIFCAASATDRERVDARTCAICRIPELMNEIGCSFFDARRTMESTLPGVVRELHDYYMTCAIGDELKITGKKTCESCPHRSIRRPGLDIHAKFTARNAELTNLKTCLNAALEGRGNVVIVSGELGIGKTRLMNELKQYALLRGVRVSDGRCLYSDNFTPYLPFKEILKQYLVELQETDDQAPLKKLSALNGLTKLLPIEVLAAAREHASDNIDLDMGKSRMFEAFYRAIELMAEDGPLVLWIDDLQYADVASLQLLHYLARNIKTKMVLILCTYRSEAIVKHGEARHPLSETLERMGAERLYLSLELSRLDPEATRTMIVSIFARALPQKFTEFIYEKTDGNPLFIEELIKALYSGEQFANMTTANWSDQTFSLALQKLAEMDVPKTIKDLIERQLERLSKTEKSTLAYASVIGDRFDFDTILNATGMDEELILNCIESLIGARILYEHPTIEDLYAFNHVMMREVIYNGLSEKRQKILHKKVGDTFESSGAVKDAGILAIHFFKARDYQKALRYCEMAGDNAKAVFALNEAMNYYEMALTSFGKIVAAPGTPCQELALLDKFGHLCFTLGELDRAIETCEKMNAICEASKNDSVKSKTFRFLGEIHAIRLNWEEALRCYASGVKLSSKIDDAPGLSEAKRGIGMVHCRMGRYARALQCLKDSFAIGQSTKDPAILAHTQMDMGTVHWYMGQYDDAITNYAESLKRFEATGDRRLSLRAIINLGAAYTRKGDTKRAIDYYNRAIKLSQSLKDKRLNAYAMSNAAEELIKLGELEQALAYCAKASATFEKMGETHMQANTHMVYGIAYTSKKDWTASSYHFKKAIEIAREAHDLEMLMQNYMQFALMYKVKGDAKNATVCFQRTLALCDRLGNQKLADAAKMELAEIGARV